MPVSRIREVMELAWKDPEAIHLEVGEPDFPTPEHVVCLLYAEAPEGFGRPKAAKERFMVRASLIRSRASIRLPGR
jgi:aspartate/methionine/tyrosine aminotransferase